jgi:hypothetical protein
MPTAFLPVYFGTVALRDASAAELRDEMSEVDEEYAALVEGN